MVVRFKRAEPGAKEPIKMTLGSSGYDLHASQKYTIYAGTIVAVSTGLILEIPDGYEGQIRSRSGLALKGVTVANAPGTIDSDYRGVIKVLLRVDAHKKPFDVKPGDRIAQLIIAKVEDPTWIEDSTITDAIGENERGSGGLGSTGVR